MRDAGLSPKLMYCFFLRVLTCLALRLECVVLCMRRVAFEKPLHPSTFNTVVLCSRENAFVLHVNYSWFKCCVNISSYHMNNKWTWLTCYMYIIRQSDSLTVKWESRPTVVLHLLMWCIGIFRSSVCWCPIKLLKCVFTDGADWFRWCWGFWLWS